MILRILMSIVILIVIPFCVGLIPTNFMEKQNRCIGVIYLSGLIATLAVFQMIAVPVVILNGAGFKTIVWSFSVITVLLSVTGIVLTVYGIRKEPEEENRTFLNIFFKEKKQNWFQGMTKKEKGVELLMWLFVFILIGYQMFMACYCAFIDGDDAYYVVQSVLTDETNTLYRIRPYTGLSTGMDLRHALAVFPVWIAYIARMTGIHATIVAHTVLPLIFIPVTYLIYLEIGKRLLKRDTHKLPYFMIFICVLQIFGKVSIYTSQTFFLTRTWQGKSLLANLVLPAIIWLIFWIFDGDGFDKKGNAGLWILLTLTNFVAAMSSTASVFLAAMLIGITGVVLGIRERKVQIPLQLMITCIPLVFYGAIFLLL